VAPQKEAEKGRKRQKGATGVIESPVAQKVYTLLEVVYTILKQKSIYAQEIVYIFQIFSLFSPYFLQTGAILI
jgi:hypothetical protein